MTQRPPSLLSFLRQWRSQQLRRGPHSHSRSRSPHTLFDFQYQRRTFRDYVRCKTESGSARIPLKENRVFGVATSRGTRAYQEDTYSSACLHIPSNELKRSHLRSNSKVARDAVAGWDVKDAGGEELAGQVVWFGCFDG